ncbi:hypothetical protein BDN70DRAFT_870031 [Pholiota conissans]|uniref:Uncharacterized protein n=1 Tax=Pholiota conissans TaxID=109636 RepID=A0A9P5ZFG2_9AGAR|nr:hypothetical protein BDN70DRAFT_870031 [Pholiota conissans]
MDVTQQAVYSRSSVKNVLEVNICRKFLIKDLDVNGDLPASLHIGQYTSMYGRFQGPALQSTIPSQATRGVSQQQPVI